MILLVATTPVCIHCLICGIKLPATSIRCFNRALAAHGRAHTAPLTCWMTCFTVSANSSLCRYVCWTIFGFSSFVVVNR